MLIPEAPWFKKSGKSDQSCHHETWIHLPTRAGSNAVVLFPHATAVIGNLWPANEEALATGNHLRCTSSSTGERMSLPSVKCVLMVPPPCVFLVLASFFTRVIHAICLHPAFPNLYHEKKLNKSTWENQHHCLRPLGVQPTRLRNKQRYGRAIIVGLLYSLCRH